MFTPLRTRRLLDRFPCQSPSNGRRRDDEGLGDSLIYQDPQNERGRARAAEARRSMRAFLSEAERNEKKAA